MYPWAPRAHGSRCGPTASGRHTHPAGPGHPRGARSARMPFADGPLKRTDKGPSNPVEARPPPRQGRWRAARPPPRRCRGAPGNLLHEGVEVPPARRGHSLPGCRACRLVEAWAAGPRAPAGRPTGAWAAGHRLVDQPVGCRPTAALPPDGARLSPDVARHAQLLVRCHFTHLTGAGTGCRRWPTTVCRPTHPAESGHSRDARATHMPLAAGP